MLLSKPDFSRSPDAFFALAGRTDLIQFLEPNPTSWEAVPAANILAFSCSAHQPVNDEVNRHIRFHNAKRSFAKAIKINSHPVVLSDARYFKSFVGVGGKWLLNGASGTRLRNKYFAHHVDDNEGIDMDVDAFFAAARAVAPDHLPVVPDGTELGELSFAIECRNTFNFYHFLVETLGQLCIAVDAGITRKIRIHSPTKEPADFVVRYIDALFPELRGRVKFVHKPKHYDRVVSSYNFLHGYPHLSRAVMPSFEHLAPPSDVYVPRSALRQSLGVVAMNSFDGALSALRDRGLLLSKAKVTPDMPERIWIGRRPGGKRERKMKGQAALMSSIKKLGFVEVFLEDLPPLEQIALINNAKIIMSVHGAGLANMIFANSAATVIELGNAHTALYRWGDFTRLAHVAGCTYTNFFADMLSDTPDTLEGLRSNSLPPVHLSPTARKQIMTYLHELTASADDIGSFGKLKTLSESLNAKGHHDEVYELLCQHPKWVTSDPELSVHMANAYRERGNKRATLDLLTNAFRLAPDRPQLFARIVHLTATVHSREKALALLGKCDALFPDHADDIRHSFAAAFPQAQPKQTKTK